MRFLFDDRAPWLKIGAAILAVTALCWHARRTLGEAYPSLGAIRMYPERYEGRVASLPPLVIATGGENRFTVERDRLALVVHATGTWTTGSRVTVRGVVRNGEVIADTVRVYEGYFWKRAVMYGVSFVLVLFLAWRLLRRTRLDRGLFEARY